MSDARPGVGTERRHYRFKVWHTDELSEDEDGSYPVTVVSDVPPLRFMVSTQQSSLYASNEPILKRDVRTAISASIKSQASLVEWLGRILTKIWVPATEYPAIIDRIIQVLQSAVSKCPIYVDIRLLLLYENLYAPVGTRKKIALPVGHDYSICMDPMDRMQPGVRSFPCNHLFHPDCILPWIKSKGSCPNCRVLFDQDDDLFADEDPEPDEHAAPEVEVEEPHH